MWKDEHLRSIALFAINCFLIKPTPVSVTQPVTVVSAVIVLVTSFCPRGLWTYMYIVPSLIFELTPPNLVMFPRIYLGTSLCANWNVQWIWCYHRNQSGRKGRGQERGALRWCGVTFSTGIRTLTHCVPQPHLETHVDSKFRADDLTQLILDSCRIMR